MHDTYFKPLSMLDFVFIFPIAQSQDHLRLSEIWPWSCYKWASLVINPKYIMLIAYWLLILSCLRNKLQKVIIEITHFVLNLFKGVKVVLNYPSIKQIRPLKEKSWLMLPTLIICPFLLNLRETTLGPPCSPQTLKLGKLKFLSQFGLVYTKLLTFLLIKHLYHRVSMLSKIPLILTRPYTFHLHSYQAYCSHVTLLY